MLPLILSRVHQSSENHPGCLQASSWGSQYVRQEWGRGACTHDSFDSAGRFSREQNKQPYTAWWQYKRWDSLPVLAESAQLSVMQHCSGCQRVFTHEGSLYAPQEMIECEKCKLWSKLHTCAHVEPGSTPSWSLQQLRLVHSAPRLQLQDSRMGQCVMGRQR